MHGAAVAAVKEFAPTLIKWGVIALSVLLVLPFLIVCALPNIFFRYDSRAKADVTAMTTKAEIIEKAYAEAQAGADNALEMQVAEYLAAYVTANPDATDIDEVEIRRNTGITNDYWYIAINSVAHQQDLFTMDEEEVKKRTIFNTLFTFGIPFLEEQAPQDDQAETIKKLTIDVEDTNPEALMNELNFTDEQKNWARLLYSTMADDQIIKPGDPDYALANIDYGNIRFTEGQTPVTYYNQGDIRWGNKLYGKYDTIKVAGCGPTTLAMVVSSLTGEAVTPNMVADWSVANGYRCEGSGSYHSLIPDGAQHYGRREGACRRPCQRPVERTGMGFAARAG